MNVKKFSILFCCVLSVSCTDAFSQLKNIGAAINSEYAELNPIVSNGGNRLYFVVQNHPANYKAATQKTTQDIWYSDRDSNGVWGPRIHMPQSVNSFIINSIEATDPAGNILILKGAVVDGKYKDQGYSTTRLTKSGWSSPEKISIGNDAEMNKGAFAGLTWCPNLKAIIFSFSPNPGATKPDLYIAFKEGLNAYSKPIPLKILNTAFDESTPYIASDNRTLYFVSNRTGSVGSRDIYMSKRIGDDWDNWSAPVNIGPATNADRDDSYYSIDPANKFAYIVSSKNTLGKEDIFIAPIDKQFQPAHVYVINGKLVDGITLKPLSGEVSYHDLITSTEHGTGISENTTGEYTIFLEKDYVYGISATAAKYISMSYYVDTKEIDSTHFKEIDLYLFPIQKGTILPLDNLFFKTSSAEILPESSIELNRITAMLIEYPAMKLKITGYTDNTGSDALNQALSLKRAEAVKNYLIGKGFSDKHFDVEGLGKAHPIASNASATSRQKNRRVEITILQID